ncbi:MAG: hypothetical protein EOP81_14280 [Variovorax sp.]|nr:MAG: hypothetical protein EOP81_14280 [Variovorax sp.]
MPNLAPARLVRSSWFHPPVTVQPGDVIPACRPCAYLAPFGILSLAVWGLWAIAIFAPITGWINKRELMQQQVAAWTPDIWAAVVGIPLAILAVQLGTSAWLARRRIEVHADRVIVRGVLRDTEVPIQGVVSVVQHFDMHALSSSLRLRYHSETRVRTVSGWLFGGQVMTALGAYIVQRNRIFDASMEARLH